MIVDVHGHITHPELLAKYPMPPSLGDVEGMVEQKAAAGISVTIVGSPVGFGVMMRGVDNYAQPLDRLKAHNEWHAEMAGRYPGRLKAYAYTNPFGGGKLLEQAAETVREHDDVVGLIVNTSVRGRYLDDPGANDFFEMATELDVPVLLHAPAEPVGSESLRDFRLVEQVGRFCDVTLGLAAVVFGGCLERYPRLKLIGATAGGAISLVGHRLDEAYRPRHWAGATGAPPGGPPAHDDALTRPPSEYLRQLHVDTASFSVPNHLANLEVMGAERMLFATDSPPLKRPLHDVIALVDRLPIDDAAKRKIFRENAEQLFGFGVAAPPAADEADVADGSVVARQPRV